MTLSELIASLEPGDRISLANEYTVCLVNGIKMMRALVVVTTKYEGYSSYIDVDSHLSTPPVGQFKVVNLYVDSKTHKLAVQWDDNAA